MPLERSECGAAGGVEAVDDKAVLDEVEGDVPYRLPLFDEEGDPLLPPKSLSNLDCCRLSLSLNDEGSGYGEVDEGEEE